VVTTRTAKTKRVARRSCQNTNKYSGEIKPDGNRRRTKYFKVYRPERTCLNILENIFPKTYSYKERRACRYIYLFVIPHLARYLLFEPDRVRLREVERQFYNIELSFLLRLNRDTEPNRIPVLSYFRSRDNRHTMPEGHGNSAKL